MNTAVSQLLHDEEMLALGDTDHFHLDISPNFGDIRVLMNSSGKYDIIYSPYKYDSMVSHDLVLTQQQQKIHNIESQYIYKYCDSIDSGDVSRHTAC